MSNYIDPQRDIILDLIDAGIVSMGEVFQDFTPTFQEVADNINVLTAVKLTTGTSNPRWARDDLFINIRVLGRDRTNIQECRNLINAIYNHLVGRATFERGDYLYTQFNSTVYPNFVGYQQNSMPLFVCSISLVREAQVKEGNRDPLC